MKNFIAFVVIIFCAIPGSAQELEAFQFYGEDGNQVSFSQMIDKLADYDVVLFGEFHNNSIVHWLQLRTAKALYRKKGEKLLLGAEMFERDNQQALNLYLSDSIDLKELKKRARLWPNFETDYLPLLDFAKKNDLAFVATNVPRRYARYVADHGLDTLQTLPEKDRSFIAELPIKVDLETPGYQEMKTMLANHAGIKVMNFIQAQAIKDATMAESILKHKTERKQLLLHFNGNYHSKAHGGIYWYIAQQKPWLKRVKVAVITVAASKKPELSLPKDIAPTEFILVVPEDMTKTY